MSRVKQRVIGEVGIDSGQLVITDPGCIVDFESDDAPKLAEYGQPARRSGYPYSFGGACLASSNKSGGGQLGTLSGVAVQTGHGDGQYPVWVNYAEDGRVERVIIEFM